MRKFRFNKLVRDKIHLNMIKAGDQPVVRKLTDGEYLAALTEKLKEECLELDVASPGKMAEELADIQEVVDCICKVMGVTKDQLAVLQQAKNIKAGSFKDKIHIDTVQVSDASPWIKHLELNPDRYPEIK